MSTNNFLFEFNNTKETSKESELPVSSIFKRGLAGIIDVHITVILMAIYLEISFRLFYYQKYKKFFLKDSNFRITMPNFPKLLGLSRNWFDLELNLVISLEKCLFLVAKVRGGGLIWWLILLSLFISQEKWRVQQLQMMLEML